MKLFTALVLLLSLSCAAQQTEKFSTQLETAKSEHKPLLLYFSGSDWCAPCVKFKKFMINTDTFKAFASQNLIVHNADFPRLKKNQLSSELTLENEQLAEKYNPKGIFPLILLLDSNGIVQKKWEQYPTETLEEFIAKLKE